MRTVGIVVEYNPFHNGHLYHLQQAKKVTESEAVVAVMSGNFLQRGEPALVDKWTRAQMALCGGADLVLEIPAVYACRSAEWFSYGSVATLEATGIVDSLCFGSESGELEWMRRVTKTLADEPEVFSEMLQQHLKKGWSYPKAFSEALTCYFPDRGAELAMPNNILGLSYIIALHRLRSSIRPFTVRREKASYHEAAPSDDRIASATAIRQSWLKTGGLESIRPYVPQATYELLSQTVREGGEPVTWESFRQVLFTRLVTLTEAELRDYPEVEEGLEYRLKRQLKKAESVHDYLNALKTKRYTWNRLQRTLTYILLGLTKTDLVSLNLDAGPTYIRVLGFTDRGKALLKEMREKAALPVFTRIRQDHPSMLEWDIKAGAVYALATNGRLPITTESLMTPAYFPAAGDGGSFSKY